jgi:hypothetical protein
MRGEFFVDRRMRIRWRGAIGWIAAYALALQTIAGGIDLTQSAAAAATLDTTAVICHGDGADSAADLPGSTGDRQPCGHCGCCLDAPSLLAPHAPAHFVAAVLAAGDIVWPPAEQQNTSAVRYPSQRPRGPPPQA